MESACVEKAVLLLSTHMQCNKVLICRSPQTPVQWYKTKEWRDKAESYYSNRSSSDSNSNTSSCGNILSCIKMYNNPQRVGGSNLYSVWILFFRMNLYGRWQYYIIILVLLVKILNLRTRSSSALSSTESQVSLIIRNQLHVYLYVFY